MKYPGDDADMEDLISWWTQSPEELFRSYAVTQQEIRRRTKILHAALHPEKTEVALRTSWHRWKIGKSRMPIVVEIAVTAPSVVKACEGILARREESA